MRDALHLFAAPLLAILIATPTMPAQDAPARLLEGRVHDVLGDGIPAAKVQALAGGRTIAATIADGEGVYRIRVPGTGALLLVSAAGRVPERLAWRGETTPRVRNVVLEDAGTLRGKVTDGQGRPLANAMVTAASRTNSATVMTDAGGRYELSAPLRDLVVRALAETGWVETELRLHGDAVCDLAITGTSGPCLVQVGNVPVGQSGTLRIFGPDLAAVAEGGVLPLRSDATARLFVRSRCLVQANVPGQELAPGTHLAESSTSSLAFRVAGPSDPAAGSLLRGQVRTSTGQAVGGTRVVVRDRSQRELGAVTTDRFGEFRVRVAVPPDGFVRVGLRLSQWVVLHDELTVHDGFAWAPCPAGVNLPVDLLVEPAGLLRDVVRSPAGGAFAFADVVVADPDHPHKPLLVLQSDLGGVIDVGLPPGRCEVLAVSQRGEVCHAVLGVQPGVLVNPIWQPIASGTVEGMLRDDQGAPLGGVEIWLGSLAHGEVRASERQSCRVRTDRHGRFRCRGVPAGDWSIVANEGTRSQSTEGIVRADATLAVELRLPRQ